MQKEIPILFSTPMVKAIIAGHKTETRRIVKPQPIDNTEVDGNFYGGNHKGYVKVDGHPNWRKQFANEFSRYGQPGDLLWVRETITILEPEHCMGGMDSRFVYKANMDVDSEEIRQEYIKCGYPYQWTPSIHMPKAAARIWLQNEGVQIERLQDITEAGAIAEGIDVKNISGDWDHSPVQEYERLWNTINGAKSWEENPWVWVIKFKVLSTTGRPKL